MIWLLPMLSPPVLFPVARIAPLFPVLLIVLLLRPGVSASAPRDKSLAPDGGHDGNNGTERRDQTSRCRPMSGRSF